MKKNLTENILLYKRDPELYFRVGLRHAGKQMYSHALKFLTEAAEKEPYNSDYQFNLACVLAELREVKKSNEIFLNIIKNIDPTYTECYFGVACNFFDSGNFKKALEYFEKYILIDDEGDLVDEAYDVISYLKLYSDSGTDTRKAKSFEKLTTEARKCLLENEPAKAVTKLEKAIEIRPEAVFQRALLAFALHLAKKPERAELLAQSALKLDSGSILTHLVLCLIYAAGNKGEELQKSLTDISGNIVQDIEAFDSDCSQFKALIEIDDQVSEDEKTLIMSILSKIYSSVLKAMEKDRENILAENESRVLTFPADKNKAKSKSKRKKEKE